MTAAKKAAEAPKDVPDAGSRLPAGDADNQASSTPPHAGHTAVYLVRPGKRNEELRYSLRSLANTPVERVVVVGYCPPSIQPDAYVPTDQKLGDKKTNLRRGYEALVASDAVPEQFSLWWDDIYAMRPVTLAPLHRGPLRPLLARMRRHSGPTGYWKGLSAVADLLPDDALAYEPLHAPQPVTKTSVAKALALHDSHNGMRTLLGNLDQIGGTEHPNVKNADPEQWGQLDYLSTSDKSFKYRDIGRHIRKRFPDPSRWET